jgi:hypothetical protein
VRLRAIRRERRRGSPKRTGPWGARTGGACAGRQGDGRCRRAPHTRKATSWIPLWQGGYGPGGVGDLWPAWKHCERNPGGPASGLAQRCQVRTRNPRGTPVMHGCRESDRFRVPRKPSNNGCPEEPAEEVEGRERAQGNVAVHTRDRTQGRVTPVTHARPRTAGPFGGLHVRPEAGARCGSAARRDLCGGCRVTGIPTVTSVFLL